MKKAKLLLYITLVRIIPKALRWRKSLLLGNMASWGDQKVGYTEMNLASNTYQYLKEHCQNGLHSGEFTQLPVSFSPIGLKIDMPICTAIRKMGSTPDYVIDNSEYLNGHYTLFYKRRIRNLRCTFEMHFHKSRLFLLQVKVYEKCNHIQTKRSDFIYLLLNAEGDSILEDCTSGVRYFQDTRNQFICGINNLFSTNFILSNPNGSSLNELLFAKYKKSEYGSTDSNATFKHTFIKA